MRAIMVFCYKKKIPERCCMVAECDSKAILETRRDLKFLLFWKCRQRENIPLIDADKFENMDLDKTSVMAVRQLWGVVCV